MNHTAFVPVSGWVRTRGCTVGGFVASRWAFTISGLPVFIRALLISVFSVFAPAIFSFTSSEVQTSTPLSFTGPQPMSEP